jgi:hypothetical protein
VAHRISETIGSASKPGHHLYSSDQELPLPENPQCSPRLSVLNPFGLPFDVYFVFRSALRMPECEEELCRPTSGRWLWNETSQLSLHTRRFNVQALKDIAARAVNAKSGGRGVHIRKLAEDGSNKVFTATARD